MMDENPSLKRTRVLWVVALIAVMTYLLVGASREFGPFAPLPINPAILNTAAVLGGLLAVLVTREMPEGRQVAVLGAVAVSPFLIYGIMLVTFWTALASTAFLDYFILAAGQRILVYSMTTGVLIICSMMATLIVVAFSSF